ncbi:MAG: alpha/beta hydrolase [Gemmatimonadaceae bacterium]|nr:alpha/beta hydrolase [Gemmatimonadaceae bacterium]
MGKNKTRPADYRPLLQLYLRKNAEGGALLSPADIRTSADELTRRECVVLVHGFNNTDSEASEAYLGFRTREKEIFSPADPQTFEHLFADAFWPGDADWWSFFDRADFLIYPAAVHTAVRAARELANALWRMPNLETVDFIGHSLGSRVVLETLLLLRARAMPRIRRVALMAAAVPSEMLEPRGRFYDLLIALQGDGSTIDILHSKADTVLHYAFPPGQSLAGGREASERALGRFGPSPLMPGYRANVSEREIGGAAHGDYWGHSKTASSRVATEEAGRFLRLGEFKREIGTVRVTGSSAAEIKARELGVTRTIGEIGY